MTMRVLGQGPMPARILLVGEAPGAHEEAEGRPFVGRAGECLNAMLRDAGIDRYQCRVTNVFKTRPGPDNDIGRFLTFRKNEGEARNWRPHGGAWINPLAFDDLAELEREIAATQPHIIVPLGSTALWATLGYPLPIGTARGNIFASRLGKLLPTYHPAFIERSWGDRPVAVHDLRRAKTESATPELIMRPENFIIRPNFEQVCTTLYDLLGRAASHDLPYLSVDIETRGTWMACIGLAWTKRDALCIPFMCTERRAGYWSADEEHTIVSLLRLLLVHPNVWLVGANFLYDIQYLERDWCCFPQQIHDVQIMHHTIFPNMRKALGFLATMYAAQPRFWKEDGKTWTARMDEDILWQYNCRDVTYTLEIFHTLRRVLEAYNQWPQYEFLLSLFPCVLDMSRRGIRRDAQLTKEFSAELAAIEAERTAYIERLLGHPLNVNSPKQLMRLFYDDFRIKPVSKYTEDGTRPTVDEDALDIIQLREPLVQPIVRAIKDVRRASKLRATFVDVPVEGDGRLRCTFSLTGTKTFRFNATTSPFETGTNVQNTPRNPGIVSEIMHARRQMPLAELLAHPGVKQSDIDLAEEDEIISITPTGLVIFRFAGLPVRNLFVPDEGQTLIDMDLARADLYVDAWESDDASLKELLRAGVDIHTENARVVKLDRQTAKVFVHATNKGGKARTVAMHCGLTTHQAEVSQRRWFAEHPGIRDLHNRIMAIGNSRNPVLTNIFGHRFPLVKREHENMKEGMAWLAQSVVARVINTAMIRLMELPWLSMFLQVHDSLVFGVPTERMPSCLPELERRARVIVPYPDPLVIPVGFKASTKSWGDCKEILVPLGAST